MKNRLWLATSMAIVVGTIAPSQAAEGGAKPSAIWWLVRPSQIEPKILGWMAKYPQLVSLESQKTFEGRSAYALTVTDRTVDEASKRRLLFSQPHAHEPAATAGMMDFLSQLLDRTHLDGRPTELACDELLRRSVLTFIPIGNPDGRARSPEDWWDGTKYGNDEFLKYAFGCEEDGQRCARVGRFDVSQHRPGRIGIVYERINDREYVEPNRDTDSTYFKLVHRLLARRSCADGRSAPDGIWRQIETECDGASAVHAEGVAPADPDDKSSRRRDCDRGMAQGRGQSGSGGPITTLRRGPTALLPAVLERHLPQHTMRQHRDPEQQRPYAAPQATGAYRDRNSGQYPSDHWPPRGRILLSSPGNRVCQDRCR